MSSEQGGTVELRKHEDVCPGAGPTTADCCGDGCCCGWYEQAREWGPVMRE